MGKGLDGNDSGCLGHAELGASDGAGAVRAVAEAVAIFVVTGKVGSPYGPAAEGRVSDVDLMKKEEERRGS